MKSVLSSALLLAAALALPAAAQAGEFNSAGTWSVGVGAHQTNPDSDSDISASSSTRASVSGEYFVRDNLGVELFLSAPTKHGLSADGFGHFANTKLVMPMALAKYHFDGMGAWSPYVGLGVAYADFRSTGFTFDSGLSSLDMDLQDEWAPVANVGVDYKINDRSAIRADVRYVDLSPNVRVAGMPAGKQKLDPMIYGVSYVRQF
jgi:outer membrane protein